MRRLRRRLLDTVDKIASSTQLPQNVVDINYSETLHDNVKWIDRNKRRLSLISFIVAILLVSGTMVIWQTFKLASRKNPLDNGNIPFAEDSDPASPSVRKSDKLHPLLNAGVFVFDSEDAIPRMFWEPCRRLSQEEIKSGYILSSYRIEDIYLTMCRALHDFAGCDKEESIPTKMLQLQHTEEIINICLIVYKPKEGDCKLYMNPVLHRNPDKIDLRYGYRHKSFPYLGIISTEANNQILITGNHYF